MKLKNSPSAAGPVRPRPSAPFGAPRQPAGQRRRRCARYAGRPAQQRLECAAAETMQLFERFHSHPEGITAHEAEQVRQRCGENVIDDQQKEARWQHLWHCYRNPFNLLLTALGMISYATEDLTGALVIALMVLISTLLNFIRRRAPTVRPTR